MSDAHCPRFPIPDVADPENQCPVSLPPSREEAIFLFQIDAGLRFPYCLDLVEMCHHCRVSPTQITPNVVRVWAVFCVLCQQSGWCYSLVLFRHFYHLRSNHFSVFLFVSRKTDFKYQ